MSVRSLDTHPSAAAVMIDGLRKMGGARRLARAFELRDAALGLAAARLREQYGVLDRRELQLRLASLWLDAATMRRAFGWPDDASRGHEP